MRKDPEQRYASVEQFDEDLRRYLHDLPVIAQGLSFGYRTRKFLSRYRAAVAAAATMFLLLAGGIVATSFEARIAGKERARAEAHARLAEVAKAVADQERATAERRALEAQQQKIIAERRLAELQKLAHGAAQIYAATRERSGSADRSLIAQNSRDLLMTLRRENALEPGVGLTLRALVDRSSSASSTDDSWHIPVGWEAGESNPHEYSISLDQRVVHGGKSSLLLHSIVPRPRGDVYVLQTFAADRLVGKRVRLSVYTKPENVSDQASRLLIVHTRGVDNPVFLHETTSGTSKWTRLEIVADVPPDAASIAIGVDLRGAGTLRADDFGFSSVSHAVPLTNLQPKNLDFRNATN